MTPTKYLISADLHVVGLPLRTTPASASTDIPRHWARFFAEGWAQRLGVTADTPLYAVYCDYASDHRGAYTMVLGVVGDDASDALQRVTIPSGAYARLEAEGNPGDVVWRAWREINESWSARKTRRYVADFERYAPGRPADDVHVEIVVGVN